MKENETEQISLADNVEIKEESCSKNAGEISLGKFKDVNALLNAYNSLQAEFTKRCQKIKELEGKETKTDDTVVVLEEKGNEKESRKITDEEKATIVKEYLKNLMDNNNKMVFIEDDGVIVKTTIEKPKTIYEAGSLAKSIFNK